ncbi:MAG: ribonuclease P protein component [Actinomycetia bacterium]|nr:ribonuclease P protein component [Actinomycetes bacterium]
MLPAVHRLRDGDGFRTATRRGERARSRTLVAHLRLPENNGRPENEGESGPVLAALVGFVVGRQVGSAVVRNRVKRRLRHLVRDRLALLPEGSALVVRALPSSASASHLELSADLDRVLARFRLDRS